MSKERFKYAELERRIGDVYFTLSNVIAGLVAALLWELLSPLFMEAGHATRGGIAALIGGLLFLTWPLLRLPLEWVAGKISKRNVRADWPIDGRPTKAEWPDGNEYRKKAGDALAKLKAGPNNTEIAELGLILKKEQLTTKGTCITATPVASPLAQKMTIRDWDGNDQVTTAKIAVLGLVENLKNQFRSELSKLKTGEAWTTHPSVFHKDSEVPVTVVKRRRGLWDWNYSLYIGVPIGETSTHTAVRIREAQYGHTPAEVNELLDAMALRIMIEFNKNNETWSDLCDVANEVQNS